MSEIEVGEYIRTEEGYILKNVVAEHKHIIDNYEEYQYKFGKIVKHSKDIIELIEVGDFVNEMKLEQFDDEEGNLFLGFPIYDDALMDCIKEVKPLDTIEIKTILTKEQHNQNCYRLEE